MIYDYDMIVKLQYVFLLFSHKFISKIQDTTVTHTANISQRLALYCLETDKKYIKETSQSWVTQTVQTLKDVRAILWTVVEPLGTLYTKGAFYFLVPVPPEVRIKVCMYVCAFVFLCMCVRMYVYVFIIYVPQ